MAEKGGCKYEARLSAMPRSTEIVEVLFRDFYENASELAAMSPAQILEKYQWPDSKSNRNRLGLARMGAINKIYRDREQKRRQSRTN